MQLGSYSGLASVMALMLFGAPMSAQTTPNLVSNPEFDTNIANWTLPAGGFSEWRTKDRFLSGSSGSLLLRDDDGVAGVSAQAFSECFEVQEGEIQLGGRLFVPPGQSLTSIALLGIRSYSNPDCTVLNSAPGSNNSIQVGVWFSKEAGSTLPPGTQSARFRLVAGSGSTADFEVHLDGLFIRRVPIFANGFRSGETSAWTDAPQGDTCGNPLTIEVLDPFFSGDDNTQNFAPDYSYSSFACPGVSGSAGLAAPDVVFRFVAPETASYRFELNAPGANGFDSNIYVVTNCGAIDTTCLGAADEIGSGTTEILDLALIGGQTYYIIVDGSSDHLIENAGEFNLLVFHL